MADAAGELPGSARGPRRARRARTSRSPRSSSAGETRRHLMAIYGYARLVDQIGDASAGDRLASLDAFEADLDRVFDGAEPDHPVLRRLQATVAALDLPRGPFDAPDRGEPARPGRRSRTRPSTSSSATATSRRTPSASSSSTSSAPRHPTGSRSPTASAPRSSSPSTGRTSPRTHAAGRVYLPAEDLDASASRATISARHATRPALRELMAFEVDRARRLLDEGAPLVGAPPRPRPIAVAGYVGGGRAALDAIDAAGYDVLAGAPKASARRPRHARLCDLAQEAVTGERRRAGLRALPPRRPGVRLELLRRDAAAAAGAARCALRVYALARRIDDIADGALAADEKLAELEATRASAGLSPPRATSRARRGRATPPRRFPIPLEAFGDLVDGAEARRARRPLRDVRRARALLPLRRRLDRPALARRLRLLRPRAPAPCSPTTSASRSRSGTSCATSARTPPAGASTCPREDLERFGCEAATAELRRADRARDRLRGRARPRLAPARARARAAARPAQRLLRARDGRQVPAPARADRRRAGARPARPALAPAVGEGARARPQPRRGCGAHRSGARLRVRAVRARDRRTAALAGLAAAIECADGGAAVTLYEARSRLGGATFSFERNGL